MGFPATATFPSETGPVDVTVTAHPETGAPHLVHFSTEAGLCAHFLVREWSKLNSHLYQMIEDAKAGDAGPDEPAPAVIPAQRDDDQAPLGGQLTSTQPFLAPTDTPAAPEAA